MEEVDARFKRALAACAREERPLKEQFYGDRSGTLVDPFGHAWTLATRKEEVSHAELEERLKSSMKEAGT